VKIEFCTEVATGHIVKELNEENQHPIFSKRKLFSSMEEKSFSLENSCPSFTMPNRGKLKNYFSEKSFSPNQTLQ